MPPTYGVELSSKGKASLCLYQTEEKPAPLHLAFRARIASKSKLSIARLWRRVAKTMVHLVCARNTFVIGPDGHNIEVVCHEPEA
jgi:hypothetical protein